MKRKFALWKQLKKCSSSKGIDRSSLSVRHVQLNGLGKSFNLVTNAFLFHLITMTPGEAVLQSACLTIFWKLNFHREGSICVHEKICFQSSPYSVRMQENAGQNNSKYGHHFMYEKKNKLGQSAPILDEVSVRLSNVVYCNINEKCAILI